jgi:hypothetical protein
MFRRSAVMTVEAQWIGPETNPGCPCPSGAITCVANPRVHMKDCA